MTRQLAGLRRALVLAALLVPVGPAAAQLTGTVVLDGQTVGSGSGPRDHSSTYSGADKVTVTYTIATKVMNGKTVFDPANSKIVMKSAKWGWSTVDIPLTDVQGDPATGKITGLTFDAPKWYKNPPKDLVDKGIKGTVTIDDKGKASGTVTGAYEDSSGKTKSNYAFTTDPQRPGAPKGGDLNGGKPFVATTQVDAGHSLDFDAATGILSIRGDTVVDTPLPNDPLLGAALSFPDFTFRGFNTPLGLAVFWAADDTPMTIAGGAGVLQRSSIPLLFYDVAQNLFYACLTGTAFAGVAPGSPFYDPSLATTPSPVLAALAGMLDPASASFDPSAGLFMTMTPDVDFAALTAGFTASAHAGAVDAHFVSDGYVLSSVPEPAPWALVGAGIVLLGGVVLRRRRPRP
jgi:hypothetical protein